MGERRCRYCQQVFQQSKFQPRQTVCSGTECQRGRRVDYHRNKIAADPEYREVCRDSPRKWRALNPDYWKQYRQKNPVSAERNRRQQQIRDRKRRLCDLANNNSAPAQIWVIEALAPGRTPLPASCKQQPAGVAVDPAT
jgi:hypothetical protein